MIFNRRNIMNVKKIEELGVINDIIISHLQESQSEYLERKKNLDFESDIGLSAVMDSPLIHKLRLQYPDIETKTSDHIQTMIGEFMHKEIQRHFIAVKGTNCHIEEPVQIKAKGEIGDWYLSGRIDILEMLADNQVKIGDIKATSSYQVATLNKEMYKYEQTGDWRELKHKYFYQLNAYAEGMRQRGYWVEDLYLIIYCKHWTNRLAWEDPNFPQYALYARSIPMLTSEQIQEYLSECVSRHQMAENPDHNYTPSCSKDDLWLSDHKEWAVMTKGKKRAVKLFKNKDEAEEYSLNVPGGFIEHRPMGIPMRCRDYCAYNTVCPQFKKMKEELGVKDE